ncbi:18182_t:CDS:1, partial [Dentiscutata erythropus]
KNTAQSTQIVLIVVFLKKKEEQKNHPSWQNSTKLDTVKNLLMPGTLFYFCGIAADV